VIKDATEKLLTASQSFSQRLHLLQHPRTTSSVATPLLGGMDGATVSAEAPQ